MVDLMNKNVKYGLDVSHLTAHLSAGGILGQCNVGIWFELLSDPPCSPDQIPVNTKRID